MKPKVSVIVPAYRTDPFIEECIDSILSQTYHELEAVIVYERDDSFMQDLLRKIDDPRIVHVKQEKNVGLSNARNMGIEASSGELIALCDGDDFFYPEKIERQVETINSGYGLTYTDVAIIDEKSRVIAESVTPEWDFRLWLKRTYITASSILFRRELGERIGFFREDLHANEDLNFLMDLSEITEFKRTPGVLTARRIHSSNMSRKILKNIGTRFSVYWDHGYHGHAIYAAVKNLTITPLLFWLMKNPSVYSKVQRIRQ
ncbi:glycosyltransferase family 2 protein [Methanothermobacter wolfeii]|uniref:glycosyltransferase family 2 protein n=1 Tax=Methanothermobacter wolfeii TaxID=145261 RepID=UPI0024B35A8C|nr:glycosyltransferase [Methanothermobacter wolfeii]MDI6701666.1 glycosyltransferase [Methanothermobacter wolfeii]